MSIIRQTLGPLFLSSGCILFEAIPILQAT